MFGEWGWYISWVCPLSELGGGNPPCDGDYDCEWRGQWELDNEGVFGSRMMMMTKNFLRFIGKQIKSG